MMISTIKQETGTRHRALRKPMQTADHHRQTGIGLIEVMLAMLIFAFTALAVGNMQTVSLGSANIANIHDDANSFAFEILEVLKADRDNACLLYTSPSPRDATLSRMPSSA